MPSKRYSTSRISHLAPIAALIFGLGIFTTAGAHGANPIQQNNIAQGMSYKCVAPPNYWGWKNPRHGDRGQLTDGKTVDEWLSGGKSIYSLPSSAGWTGQRPVVVFDLGETRSIGGIGLHTVLSPWGPWWPSRVVVMVSDDNQNFYLAHDPLTVTLDRIEPAATAEEVQASIDRVMPKKGFQPAPRWYRSEQFQASGRYVALLMDFEVSTSTVVLDEIEIYAGSGKDDGGGKGKAVFAEGGGGWKSYQLFEAIEERLSRDAESLRQRIDASSLATARKAEFLRRLEQLHAARHDVEIPLSTDFRAVLPLNSLHADIFALHAELWRATGAPPVRVWHTNRWAPLDPFTPATGDPPKLQIDMAQNSVRSDVINLSNSTAKPVVGQLQFAWVDESLKAPSVELFDVPLVDTHDMEPVASALVPLTSAAGVHSITLQPGMTTQVWLRFNSADVPPGLFDGVIQVSTPEASARDKKGGLKRIAVTVDVKPVEIPKSRALHLGGWEYAQASYYEVTGENLDAYVSVLNEYGINTVWSNSIMPAGKYDDQGNLVSPPTREPFEAYRQKFPNATLYCLASVPWSAPEPVRDKKLAAWAHDWSKYLRTRGIEPERIAILIRDEPTTAAELQLILEVGRAIRSGEPRFRIWNDIHWGDPGTAPPVLDQVMREACDIQCFNVQGYLAYPEKNDRWMAKQAREGLTWWCYTGGGSHRLTDPYVAFLLRGWFCFDKGLTGTHWWSFGDGNGGFSWNEYLNAGTTRSPLYLSEDGITTSKSMEAIREGAQDYELLRMLQEWIDQAEDSGGPADTVRAATHLLQKEVPEVLAAFDQQRMAWKEPKDRTAADRTREKILRLLGNH